jgi:hypothetical protein
MYVRWNHFSRARPGWRVCAGSSVVCILAPRGQASSAVAVYSAVCLTLYVMLLCCCSALCLQHVNTTYTRWPSKGLLGTEATNNGPYPDSISNGERYAHDILGDLNAFVQGWTDWNVLLDAQGGPNHLQNWYVRHCSSATRLICASPRAAAGTVPADELCNYLLLC